MNQFDSNLTKSLEDFMESYKMVDVEQIYSNGTEFVPIFRVKQWLKYNNINNLQSKIDKINQYIKEAKESDSCTVLPSGKISDVGYCIDALEDIEDILKEDK